MASDQQLIGRPVSVTIASGQTTSSEIGNGGLLQLVGLHFPAAMTGTTMTFTAATGSGGTFNTVKAMDGAATYSITVTAASYVPLDPRVFAGLHYVKLVSGSAEGADRTVQVIQRAIS